MKKFIYSALIAGSILGLGLCPMRGANSTQEQLTERLHQVNRAAKTGGRIQTALHAVSTETGVPLEQIEALYKRYPEEGPAGILMACVMADETKKSPEELVKKNMAGKSWTHLAKEFKVSIEKLNERLDHMDRILNSASDKPEKRKK